MSYDIQSTSAVLHSLAVVYTTILLAMYLPTLYKTHC